jgi:hypothetical protein
VPKAVGQWLRPLLVIAATIGVLGSIVTSVAVVICLAVVASASSSTEVSENAAACRSLDSADTERRNPLVGRSASWSPCNVVARTDGRARAAPGSQGSDEIAVGAKREVGGFDAVRHPELAQDVGDMHARCLRADAERIGDLDICAALCDEGQNLRFAWCEQRVRGSSLVSWRLNRRVTSEARIAPTRRDPAQQRTGREDVRYLMPAHELSLRKLTR